MSGEIIPLIPPDKPPGGPGGGPELPPEFITLETYLTGEMDVPLEGAPLEYEQPFTKWCSHHFTVLDPAPGSILSRPNAVPGMIPRVIVRTRSDHLAGCFVQIVIAHPPEFVGKDDKGNWLIAEVPEEPRAGHMSWTAVGI